MELKSVIELVVGLIVAGITPVVGYLLKEVRHNRREVVKCKESHRECEETGAKTKRMAEKAMARLTELEVKLRECTTIQTDSKGLIERWDKGAENIFGYTNLEMMGKPIGLLLPIHKQEAHRILILRAATQKLEIKDRIIETIAINKAGHELLAHVTLNTWNTESAGWHAAVEVRRVVDAYERDPTSSTAKPDSDLDPFKKPK